MPPYVPVLSIVCMVLSMLISFALPIVLSIYFYRKEKISVVAVLVGALVFFVFQGIIRIPALSILAQFDWYKDFAKNNLILYALFLGLTAGLFEEIGRYAGYRIFLKKSLEWKNGIAFGIGHGGIEAWLLVGLTNINNLFYSFMINSGAYYKIIGPTLPPETSEQVLSALTDTPSLLFLAGGIERIFAVALQIAFSIIVLYAVKNKRFIYVIYAILLHALVDSPLVILQANGLNLWLLEGIIMLEAIIAVVFTVKSRKLFENKGIAAEFESSSET